LLEEGVARCKYRFATRKDLQISKLQKGSAIKKSDRTGSAGRVGLFIGEEMKVLFKERKVLFGTFQRGKVTLCKANSAYTEDT